MPAYPLQMLNGRLSGGIVLHPILLSGGHSIGCRQNLSPNAAAHIREVGIDLCGGDWRAWLLPDKLPKLRENSIREREFLVRQGVIQL